MMIDLTPGQPKAPEPGAGPMGLLLSRDLIFTSKISGTARTLGSQVLTVGDSSQALTLIQEWRPRLVFVDLTSGDLVAPSAILAYRQAAEPGTTFLAFGPHVDTASMAAAADAGCDPVMPRSRFVRELPDLIRRYLSQEAESGNA